MIELVIASRRRDLGGFEVGRVLPFAKRRMVGPYIFFDRMGPAMFEPGLPRSADVRPHPHIGLSTITYLFEGEIMHRDSVGSEQPVRPGEVNWMTAGRGITHSERFERLRREGGPIDGIQAWVALPDAREEMDPGFWHYPSEALPVFDGDGIADILWRHGRLGTNTLWLSANPRTQLPAVANKISSIQPAIRACRPASRQPGRTSFGKAAQTPVRYGFMARLLAARPDPEHPAAGSCWSDPQGR